MSKAKVVEAMVAKPGNGIDTKVLAEKVLEAVLAAILSVVEQDGVARLPGFGTFKKVRRAERNTRNPRTGEAIKIGAHDVITFKQPKP